MEKVSSGGRKTEYRAEQERQAWWSRQMALREHIGRRKDAKTLQPSEQVAMDSTKREMLRYIAKQDARNVAERQAKIKKAVKKYGSAAVREKMAQHLSTHE